MVLKHRSQSNLFIKIIQHFSFELVYYYILNNNYTYLIFISPNAFLIFFFHIFKLIYCFKLIFFQLFLSRFVHFVGSMPTFMSDNILFSYISMFSFFSSTILRVLVTFPAYVWT